MDVSDELQNAPEINSDQLQQEPPVQYPDSDGPNFLPEQYEFGYEFGDSSGRLQHHRERADGTGHVLGRYGYVNEFGLYRTVEYISDAKGLRMIVRSNEPGLSNQNSAHVKFIVEPPPEAILKQQRLLRDTNVDIL
nr:cuticle protein 16.8-like [Parasteatoda tepidariorum]